jgi:hypothetical protein
MKLVKIVCDVCKEETDDSTRLEVLFENKYMYNSTVCDLCEKCAEKVISEVKCDGKPRYKISIPVD